MVRALWLLGDAACWPLAVLFIVWVRGEYTLASIGSLAPLVIAGVAAALHAAVGITWGPYFVSHVRGSFEEVTGVANSTFIAGLLLLCAVLALSPETVPSFVPALGGLLALLLMMTPRFVLRALRARVGVRSQIDGNVIIFGAGPRGRRARHPS